MKKGILCALDICGFVRALVKRCVGGSYDAENFAPNSGFLECAITALCMRFSRREKKGGKVVGVRGRCYSVV